MENGFCEWFSGLCVIQVHLACARYRPIRRTATHVPIPLLLSRAILRATRAWMVCKPQTSPDTSNECGHLDTAIECAAIIAIYGCPSSSSKDTVASPEQLRAAVPPDVDWVTTEVVPVVAEDFAVPLQCMMGRGMVGVMHDLSEVRARMVPSPNVWMPSILFEKQEPEMNHT